MLKRLTAMAAAALAVFALGAPVGAAPAAAGRLDRSFGNKGIVTTLVNGLSATAGDVAIQEDGKIVVVGTICCTGPENADSMFALVRYEPDGALDHSFGDGGSVITNFTAGDDFATGVALQPDGKIVVVGGVGFGQVTRHPRLGMARYDTDGSLDTSFGKGGRVFTKGFSDGGRDVGIQADGKIVAVGSGGFRFTVARYLTDGSLDPSFGKAGKAKTNFSPNDDEAFAVAVQLNGKIVAVGSAGMVAIVLARYLPDGALDPSFGKHGKVVTRPPSAHPFSTFADAVATQPNGRIVVAGFRPKPGLLRYKPTGVLDRSFGVGGETASRVRPTSVALQADGMIVVGGSIGTDFGLARYSGAGAVDRTFGRNGRVRTHVQPCTDQSSIAGLAIQHDGKIVAGGSDACVAVGGIQDGVFAVARYLAV